MAKKARDASNWTTPRQFRLSEETLAQLDWLMERLALSSRAAVIRYLAQRAVVAEEKAAGVKMRGEE